MRASRAPQGWSLSIRPMQLIQRGFLGLVVVFSAALALALVAAPAQAHPARFMHAAYKSSTPAANSVVKVAPTVVSITFEQRLSPSNLSIMVYDDNAKVVSTGQAQISSTDPYTATVTMQGDDSDIYRVDWNNVSAEDGDATLGAFVFGVDPSGATDKVPPAATATPTSSASSSSSSSGVTPLAAAFIGLGGLIVGAGITFASMRPRTQRQS